MRLICCGLLWFMRVLLQIVVIIRSVSTSMDNGINIMIGWSIPFHLPKFNNIKIKVTSAAYFIVELLCYVIMDG